MIFQNDFKWFFKMISNDLSKWFFKMIFQNDFKWFFEIISKWFLKIFSKWFILNFNQNFDFKMRRAHLKNFLRAPSLWDGRSLSWVRLYLISLWKVDLGSQRFKSLTVKKRHEKILEGSFNFFLNIFLVPVNKSQRWNKYYIFYSTGLYILIMDFLRIQWPRKRKDLNCVPTQKTTQYTVN